MLVRPSILLIVFLLLNCGLNSGVLGQYAKKQTTFEDIVERARKLSEKGYRPAKSRLPDEFLNLDYDGYRKIIWNPEKSLWKKDDLNFRLELFHPGYLFKTPVELHEFSDSHVQEIPFTSEFYEYGDLDLNPRRISRRAHYAGFRLLFPLNQDKKFDEVVSFLGASYFRALGKGQHYGKSARALAINTGLNLPEEFPVFQEFWIGKPDFESVEVEIFALLDSPSVAGAYQIKVRPGNETILDVKSTLFFRKAVDWLGLAPLTSMYWFGENSHVNYQDFRPEVHDSDGLLVETEAGTVWRALVNDGRMRKYQYDTPAIRGFGLMQRDRDFDHYQDLEAHYQARPTVWIEPLEGWGKGSVQLIEFPTDNEFFDNVVAAWVPELKPEPDQPYTVSYRLRWCGQRESTDLLARVASTRFGRPMEGRPGTRFVLEFTRPEDHEEWVPDSLRADFDGSGPAAISDIKILDNPLNDRWRVAFLVQGSEPADLACRLLRDGALVSEIWSYPWKPN